MRAFCSRGETSKISLLSFETFVCIGPTVDAERGGLHMGGVSIRGILRRRLISKDLFTKLSRDVSWGLVGILHPASLTVSFHFIIFMQG